VGGAVFRAPRVLRGHERRGRSERTMRRAARFLGDGASGIWERRRREQKNRGAGRGDGAALCWRNRGAGRRTALATYAATTEQIDGASGSWERRRRERKNRGARRGDGEALCWRNRGAGCGSGAKYGAGDVRRDDGANRRTPLATYAATTEQIDGASGSWERRRRERKNRGARRGDGEALCWRNRGAGRLTPQRRIKERPLDNYIVVEIMHYIQRQGMTNCDLLKRCNITNRKKYML
jgi:hypothetical protein